MTHRIAIFSDIHGNLQALEAIIEDLKRKNIEERICLGDTVAIGPSPKACLEKIFQENIKMVLGNHEEYFLKGAHHFPEVGEGERKHQAWVSAALTEAMQNKLRKFPYLLQEEIQGITFVFMHYARKEDHFIHINEERTSEKIIEMFSNIEGNVIFYGHEHDLKQQKVQGKATYIGVGSSGCTKNEYTYYTLLTIENGAYHIEKVELKYDREKFIKTFMEIDYPDKDFIGKVFLGINNE